ncbi:hypothetical protein AAZX31_19G192000 [Glycine max]
MEQEQLFHKNRFLNIKKYFQCFHLTCDLYLHFLFGNFWYEKEGVSGRRRGRPRKRQNIQGKKLFDEQSSSEDEDSISAYEQEHKMKGKDMRMKMID